MLESVVALFSFELDVKLAKILLNAMALFSLSYLSLFNCPSE
jgi:hypothetical protein